MATSGSYNYNLTRNNIVKRAFNIINVFAPDQTIDAGDQDFALDLLNSMLKSWQAEIRHSWNRQRATLFTAYQDQDYDLYSSGDHCTKSYVETTISTAEAASQTVISLTSTTGMTAADYIGIELTGGTRQWTTIVSVDSSTQVTITTALTGAAAAGNSVVTYTTKVDRPLEILTATWQNINDDIEIQLTQLLFEEYWLLPDKLTDGSPTAYMYNPQIGIGKLYLWPRPDNVDYIVNFTFYESIEDFDSQSDDPDLPQEWTLALIFNLAVLLAFPYGRIPELDKVEMKARELKALVLNYDNNNTSILLSPSMTSRSRLIS